MTGLAALTVACAAWRSLSAFSQPCRLQYQMVRSRTPVMAILRHTQIAITMEVYTEVPDEVTRAALKQLGDWLSRPDRSDDS
jgi:hypothetical protein